MDNLAVLNNTFFLRERTCAKKEKEKMSLNKNKKNMVQVHGGAKASAEEGRFTSTQTN